MKRMPAMVLKACRSAPAFSGTLPLGELTPIDPTQHARTLQKWDVLVLDSELTVSTVSECFRRRYDAYRNATFLEREERTSGPRQLAGAVSDRPSRGELAQARWAPPCSAVSGHLALSASTTGPSLPARRSHGQYARCGPLT